MDIFLIRLKLKLKVESYNYNVERYSPNDRYVVLALAGTLHWIARPALHHQEPGRHARGPHPRWPPHPLEKISAEL